MATGAGPFPAHSRGHGSGFPSLDASGQVRCSPHLCLAVANLLGELVEERDGSDDNEKHDERAHRAF